MSDRLGSIRFLTVLAAGFAIFLPASPGLAQQRPPDVPGWVLVNTRKVREFVPNPPKPGRGKWNLKDENDRKYFVPDSQIGKTEDRVLDSSRELSSTAERANEALEPKSKDTTTYKGAPRAYQVLGPERLLRSLDGRSYITYKVRTVTTKQETKTYQKFDKWDEQSYDERTIKKLRNVYRVKSELTFQDPKTRQTMKTRTETVLPPLEELAYGAWSRKGPYKINADKGERVIDTKTVDLARKVAKEFVSQSTAASFDAEGGVAMGASGLAYSGDRGQGAGGARNVAGAAAEKLTGAEKARSAGNAVRVSAAALAALYAAVSEGATLIDGGGARWALSFDGAALILASGGTTFRLAKGSTEGSGSKAGTLVRIDRADIAGSTVTLIGLFKSGPGKPSSTLKTGN